MFAWLVYYYFAYIRFGLHFNGYIEMTQSEVVNKMAIEMAHALGDFEKLKTCRFYINIAITIGTKYFKFDGGGGW